MKKVVILILILLLIPSVIAGLTEVKVPITVDFEGENEFYLRWKGGLEHFLWNNGSVHNDQNLEMSIYMDLNETVVCEEQSQSFTTLTEKMAGVVDICGRLADNNNLSTVMELSDCKFSTGLQTEKLTTCAADLAIATEQANQFEVCNSQRTTYKNDWETCNTALTEAKKSGKSYWIWWLFGGIIGTYFVMKRKREVASEYKEEGFDEDF